MPDADSPGLRALLEWRNGLLDAGIDESSVPLEVDLASIALNPYRTEFDRLGLVRPDAVKRYQPGILATLRMAARAATAVTPEPVSVPPAPAPSAADSVQPASAPPAGPVAARPHGGSARRNRQPSPRTATAGRVDAPSAAPSAPPPSTERDAPALSAPPAAPLSFAPHEAAARPSFAPRDPAAPPATPVGTFRALFLADDGALSIRWDEVSSPHALYRVVTSDRREPHAPEDGDLLAATDGLEATDRRPFTGPMRYIQVWVNRGVTEVAARTAQPELLCQDRVVATVRNVDLREDHGTVTCSWDPLPPGVDRVDVVRVPHAEAHRQGYLRSHLVAQDQPRRTGFTDAQCRPGEAYEYRLYAVVSVDGREEMPDPVVRSVRVAMPLDAVTDLRATRHVHGPGTTLDLTWTSPGDVEVAIYRTETGPEPGAEDAVLAAGGLAGAGLPEAARLNQPTTRSAAACAIEAVPWPPSWVRVHFTPVSLESGQARIGRTLTLTRTGALRDVVLLQRVDWQLLTFSWPEGATEVQVFITPKGSPLPDPPGEPQAHLGLRDYEREGGLRLRGVLPNECCDVHVVPAAYFAGEILRGAGVTTTYGGLVTLRYRMQDESGVRSRLMRGPRTLSLEVLSAQLSSTPRLVLVHNPYRLPLDLGDGTQMLTSSGQPVVPGQWSQIAQFEAERGRPGYHRLFVDLPPEFPADFAVLDPPLENLGGGS